MEADRPKFQTSRRHRVVNLMIDHGFGHFVNSGELVINFSKEVSLQHCENNGAQEDKLI